MRRPIKPFTVEVKRLRTRPGSEEPTTKIELAPKDQGEQQKSASTKLFAPSAGIAPPRRILESLAPEEPPAPVEQAVAEEEPLRVERKPARRKVVAADKPAPDAEQTSIRVKKLLQNKSMKAPEAIRPEQALVRRTRKPALVVRANAEEDSDSTESGVVAVVAPAVVEVAPAAQASTGAPVQSGVAKAPKKPDRRDGSAPLPRSERWKRRLPKILW